MRGRRFESYNPRQLKVTIMLSRENVQSIIDHCTFDRWQILLKSDGNRLYMQVEDPNGVDNVTNEPLPWAGRKWFLSQHMCVSEIVRTCYKAVQTAAMHELDEKFKYRGVAIYDPHRNVDLLVMIDQGVDALDTRDNRTSTI